MTVQVLQIDRKVRQVPFMPVGLADFEWSLNGTVAPSILLHEPNITPYSSDHANRWGYVQTRTPEQSMVALA